MVTTFRTSFPSLDAVRFTYSLTLLFLFFFYFPPLNAVIGKHVVKYKGHEVHYLNELEYVNGEVWANVWQV